MTINDPKLKSQLKDHLAKRFRHSEKQRRANVMTLIGLVSFAVTILSVVIVASGAIKPVIWPAVPYNGDQAEVGSHVEFIAQGATPLFEKCSYVEQKQVIGTKILHLDAAYWIADLPDGQTVLVKSPFYAPEESVRLYGVVEKYDDEINEYLTNPGKKMPPKDQPLIISSYQPTQKADPEELLHSAFKISEEPQEDDSNFIYQDREYYYKAFGKYEILASEDPLTKQNPLVFFPFIPLAAAIIIGIAAACRNADLRAEKKELDLELAELHRRSEEMEYADQNNSGRYNWP